MSAFDKARRIEPGENRYRFRDLPTLPIEAIDEADWAPCIDRFDQDTPRRFVPAQPHLYGVAVDAIGQRFLCCKKSLTPST